MTKLPEKLRLKAMAEEDIYFAKRDRELIAALRNRRLAEHLRLKTEVAKRQADALQREYTAGTDAQRRRPWRLAKYYRALVKKARRLVHRR